MLREFNWIGFDRNPPDEQRSLRSVCIIGCVQKYVAFMNGDRVRQLV